MGRLSPETSPVIKRKQEDSIRVNIRINVTRSVVGLLLVPTDTAHRPTIMEEKVHNVE